MHLRRTTSDIKRGNISLGQKIETGLQDFASHHFLAIRTGIHMTVLASLITALAGIDLQDFNATGSQWSVPDPCHCLRKRGKRQVLEDLPLYFGFGEPMALLDQGWDDFSHHGTPSLHRELVYVVTHLNTV